MQKMTTEEGQDVYEEVLEIVSYFTYAMPRISDSLWSLWPNLIHVRNPDPLYFSRAHSLHSISLSPPWQRQISARDCPLGGA